MKSNFERAAGDRDTITDALAELGARFDASPHFPAESLGMLVKSGHHRRFAPPKAGGERFDSDLHFSLGMANSLRQIGRGDLSVARLYEGHLNALLLFEWFGTVGQLEWLGRQLDRGAWFGIWATEPQPGARIEADILSGSKMFASGAGGLDFALITAGSETSERRLVIIPANDAQRANLDGWRVRGMRASMSGRYRLDGLAVDGEMLLGLPGDYDRDPRFTAGAWRFCAAQLGGIEALITEVRQGMRDVTRADPVQRARFADAVVATRTAGFWIEEAARRFAAGDADAVSIARLTRGVVEQAGFAVMEAAARLLGTASAFDGQRADKIIRDLSLYLRQAGPDHARDEAAKALLDHDVWLADNRLW